MERLREMPVENRTQLRKRIMELNAHAFEQEEAIGHKIKEMYFSVQPATLLRRWASNLRQDGEVRQDLLKAGKNVAVNFAVNTFLQKGSLVQRGLLVLAAKGLLSFLFKRKSKKVMA
jgi:hypothetical protein